MNITCTWVGVCKISTSKEENNFGAILTLWNEHSTYKFIILLKKIEVGDMFITHCR